MKHKIDVVLDGKLFASFPVDTDFQGLHMWAESSELSSSIVGGFLGIAVITIRALVSDALKDMGDNIHELFNRATDDD